MTSRPSSVPRVVTVGVGVLLLGPLAGCSDEPDPRVASVTWTEQDLPSHPGAPGRTVVRDAVQCGDRWYVVGAVFLDRPSETQDTRPAAWSSPDGQRWEAVRVEADTYWGKRAILNSVACSRDRIAVVGARSGGAHGNPRVATFHLAGDGSLVDVAALFTQYGGVSATNVGPISGGDDGWLIAGNRLSGPGVWVTDDPRGFTKVEDEPGLTDDGELESIAQAGAWDGNAWVLVGGGAVPGQLLDREPLAWTSTDGLTWSREQVPATSRPEDMQRAVALPGGRVLAVGLDGDGFAAWAREDGVWVRTAGFGSVSENHLGTPYVASLAHTSAGVLATISNSESYELWRSEDGGSWELLDVPLAPRVAGDHALVVATAERVLLLGDAGDGGRVWTGELGTQPTAPD